MATHHDLNRKIWITTRSLRFHPKALKKRSIQVHVLPDRVVCNHSALLSSIPAPKDEFAQTLLQPSNMNPKSLIAALVPEKFRLGRSPSVARQLTARFLSDASPSVSQFFIAQSPGPVSDIWPWAFNDNTE
jgi:hypothetical protein